MWHPANLLNMDQMTWEYTVRDKHFWPPENTVSQDATLIIDAGANAGLTTGLLAEEWKKATVIGIEMNPDTAQRARENVVEFSDRVQIVIAALGYPERDAIAIFTTANAVDHLKDYPWQEGTEHSVRVKTLDTVLEECGVSDQTIDFLKMDIEGAEWEVLHDGGKWPERTKVLVLEGHSNYYSGQQFIDATIALGFDVYQREDGQIIGTRK